MTSDKAPAPKLCQEPCNVLVTTPAHQRIIPRPQVPGQPDVGEYDVVPVPARQIGVTVFCRLELGHGAMHECLAPEPEMIVW